MHILNQQDVLEVENVYRTKVFVDEHAVPDVESIASAMELRVMIKRIQKTKELIAVLEVMNRLSKEELLLLEEDVQAILEAFQYTFTYEGVLKNKSFEGVW